MSSIQSCSIFATIALEVSCTHLVRRRLLTNHQKPAKHSMNSCGLTETFTSGWLAMQTSSSTKEQTRRHTTSGATRFELASTIPPCKTSWHLSNLPTPSAPNDPPLKSATTRYSINQTWTSSTSEPTPSTASHPLAYGRRTKWITTSMLLVCKGEREEKRVLVRT